MECKLCGVLTGVLVVELTKKQLCQKYNYPLYDTYQTFFQTKQTIHEIQQ